VPTLKTPSVGQPQLFASHGILFYVVILSAVFRFAKRTGIRSRRTPRLPAPPALPMGILSTILDAKAHVISRPPSNRVPHLSASFAERWEPRISTSAQHPLLKQDKARRLEIEPPTLEKARGWAASVVLRLTFQREGVGQLPSAKRWSTLTCEMSPICPGIVSDEGHHAL
jgi:hypothetical protein